jgi:hypothetical protein
MKEDILTHSSFTNVLQINSQTEMRLEIEMPSISKKWNTFLFKALCIEVYSTNFNVTGFFRKHLVDEIEELYHAN